MRDWYRKMAVLSVALAVSSAWAGEGRIDIGGAILVPTCAVSPAAAPLTADSAPSAHVFACDGVRAQRAVETSVYRLSVVRLDGTAIAGSSLLKYFAGYRAAAHAADVPLVTRVYE